MSAPHPSDHESTAAAKASDPTPTPSLFAPKRAPKHNIHSVMNFDQLLKKVEQAEDALESRERMAVADWRHLQATWRAAWTPGRVLIAGLASGFAFGRASRGRKGGGGAGFLRILSTVSGFIASANAQLAAHEAEHVADRVDAAADRDGGFPGDGPQGDGPYDGGPYGDHPGSAGAYTGGATPRDDNAHARDGASPGRGRVRSAPPHETSLPPDEAVRRAGAESARP